MTFDVCQLTDLAAVGRCLSSLLPVRGLDLSQLVLSAGVCRRCYRCVVWTCLSWYCRQVSVVAVTGAWSGPVSAGTVGRCLSSLLPVRGLDLSQLVLSQLGPVSLLPVRGLDLSQLVLSAGVCRRCYRCEVWTCLSWYCLSWDLSHCYRCEVWTCLSWYCRQVSVVAVTGARSGPVSAGTVGRCLSSLLPVRGLDLSQLVLSAGVCRRCYRCVVWTCLSWYCRQVSVVAVTSAWPWTCLSWFCRQVSVVAVTGARSGPVSAGTVGMCLSSLLPVRGLDLSQLEPVSLLPVRGLDLSQLVLSACVCRRCYRCVVWTCLSWNLSHCYRCEVWTCLSWYCRHVSVVAVTSAWSGPVSAGTVSAGTCLTVTGAWSGPVSAGTVSAGTVSAGTCLTVTGARSRPVSAGTVGRCLSSLLPVRGLDLSQLILSAGVCRRCYRCVVWTCLSWYCRQVSVVAVTGAWSGPVSAGTVGRCLSSLLPVRGLDLSQLVLSAGVCRRCYQCVVWTCLSWYCLSWDLSHCYRCVVWTCLSWYCLSWDLSHCYRCEVWTCLSWYCRQVSVVVVTGAWPWTCLSWYCRQVSVVAVTSAWSGPVSAGTVGRCLSSLLPVRGLDLSQLVLSAGVCRRCYRCVVWTCLSWYGRQVSVVAVTSARSGPVSAGTVGRCLSSLLPVRGLDLSQLVLSAGVCRRCYRCAVWTCLSWYCLSWDLSHCYRCVVWTCLSWYCRQVSVVAVTGAWSGPVSAGSVPGRRLSGGDGAAGAARGARPSALPGPGRDILRTRGHQDRLQLPVLIHATATADHRQ